MIIVSQDKDEIINFDNISSIVINDAWDDKPGQILTATDVRGNRNTLGYYKSEERAKEVLQEIIKVYKFYKGKTYYVEDEKKLLGKYEYGVYEMPVEKVDDK